MNELQFFNHPEFGAIRAMEKDNDVWFVGKDVATVLGYSNASKAVAVHVMPPCGGIAAPCAARTSGIAP